MRQGLSKVVQSGLDQMCESSSSLSEDQGRHVEWCVYSLAEEHFMEDGSMVRLKSAAKSGSHWPAQPKEVWQTQAGSVAVPKMGLLKSYPSCPPSVLRLLCVKDRQLCV